MYNQNSERQEKSRKGTSIKKPFRTKLYQSTDEMKNNDKDHFLYMHIFEANDNYS